MGLVGINNDSAKSNTKTLIYIGISLTITIILKLILKLFHKKMKTPTIFAISLGLSAGINLYIYKLYAKLSSIYL